MCKQVTCDKRPSWKMRRHLGYVHFTYVTTPLRRQSVCIISHRLDGRALVGRRGRQDWQWSKAQAAEGWGSAGAAACRRSTSPPSYPRLPAHVHSTYSQLRKRPSSVRDGSSSQDKGSLHKAVIVNWVSGSVALLPKKLLLSPPLQSVSTPHIKLLLKRDGDGDNF